MTDSDAPVKKASEATMPAEDAQASEDETVRAGGTSPTADDTQTSGGWVPL